MLNNPAEIGDLFKPAIEQHRYAMNVIVLIVTFYDIDMILMTNSEL